MELNHKVIAITGGSKGLGLATASRLVQAGAKVALLARDADALARAADTLGPGCLPLVADVADQAAVQAAFAQIEQHFGGLDGLVNNAGLARPRAIEQIRPDELMLQLNTNFVGTVYCCQAAIPLLRQRGGGLIVNLSSATVRDGNEMAHLSVYAASKAAVEVFSRDLRREISADNIGVTVVCPGAAATEFGAGWEFEPMKLALDAWMAQGPHSEGFMEADDVARAIVHCFSYPAGVTVDDLLIKPHRRTPKFTL